MRAASTACSPVCLPPNAPPVSGTITRTDSGARPKCSASWRRTPNGTCVPVQTVSFIGALAVLDPLGHRRVRLHRRVLDIRDLVRRAVRTTRRLRRSERLVGRALLPLTWTVAPARTALDRRRAQHRLELVARRPFRLRCLLPPRTLLELRERRPRLERVRRRHRREVAIVHDPDARTRTPPALPLAPAAAAPAASGSSPTSFAPIVGARSTAAYNIPGRFRSDV